MMKVNYVSCPVCQHVNACCKRNNWDLDWDYNQYVHRPFMLVNYDLWTVYHCRVCRFTCFERDLSEIYGKTYMYGSVETPCTEDFDHTDNVVAKFDFSLYGDTYDGKDLPRYHQYEIMKKLYSKSFVNEMWQLENPIIDDIAPVKLNFIIGYEYHQAGFYDKAVEAFAESFNHLTRIMKDPKLNPRIQCGLLLFSGSIKHFLGEPYSEVIEDYEQGMRMSDVFKYHSRGRELLIINSFYHNSIKVLGPFTEHPFRFIFGMRNIAWMRAFYIPFDASLLSSLLFIGVISLWFAGEIVPVNRWNIRRRFTFFCIVSPMTIGITNYVFYRLKVHGSLRSLLFIEGLWILLFYLFHKIIKIKFEDRKIPHTLLSTKYKLLLFLTLSIPWILFFSFSKNFEKELIRLFWPWRDFYDGGYEWIMASIGSMKYFLILALGVYIIPILLSFFSKKKKPGFLISILSAGISASLFYFLAQSMRVSTPGDRAPLFALFMGTLWFIFFLSIEYRIVRPLAEAFPRLWRLKFSYSSLHWILVRFAFLAYPGGFVVIHLRYNLFMLLTFLIVSTFWLIVSGLIFILHYFMAKIFKESVGKLKYSILVTALSISASYLSMSLADISKPYASPIPGLFILSGAIWLSLILQFKYHVRRAAESGKKTPNFLQYLHYNRLWGLIEFSYFFLPILYAIIRANKTGYELVRLTFGAPS